MLSTDIAATASPNITHELEQFLDEKNFKFTPILDGEFHRFGRNNGDDNAWFIGRLITTHTGATSLKARFGDWKTGEDYSFSTKGNYTPDEKRELDAQEQAQNERIRKAKTDGHEKTALVCEKRWAQAETFGTNPYMLGKGFKKEDGLFGARVAANAWGELDILVPCRDIHGKLWGIQKIMPPLAGKNTKFFAPEQKKEGCFHLISKPGTDFMGECILICEGFATGASLHMATGHPVVVAFDAGNLESVARAIRGEFPKAWIIICADDDRYGTVNVGLERATKAASSVQGIVALPKFQDRTKKPTDFNDLHQLEGLKAVREQIAAKPATMDIKGPPPMMAPTKSETIVEQKKKKITELQVANILMGEFGDKIVKDGRDVFVYTGTHWQWLDPDKDGYDKIKHRIMDLFEGKARSTQIESAFRTFRSYVPQPTGAHNMFRPNPYMANFTNGTLHILQSETGFYSYKFMPHEKKDFLTSTIPIDFDENETEENPDFLKMLDRVFENDTDKDEKIRCIRQMYGACLIPAFPHLFLLHGPKGTGKSALIIPARLLLEEDNISSVEPHEFSGFEMETMAGKLVNIVLDIKTKMAIEDANIKKIEDRVPIRIDRKYLKAVYAPLPAVHIFGGNDIPPSNDGKSGAHERRWSFIEVNKFKAEGLYDKNFAANVFRKSPKGVLKFAFEGLKDLLAQRGHFLNPASGKARMKTWQLQSDLTGLFIQDIEHDELGPNTSIKIGTDNKIKQGDLYEVFKVWCEANHSGQLRYWNKNKFFEAMESRFPRSKYDGMRVFRGIGTPHAKEGAKF